MEYNFKKVGRFLKGLQPVEFRYLELTIQITSGLQSLSKKYNLSEERFCELFHINLSKYENYLKGNYNYTVHDMAMLNAVHALLETEKIKANDSVQFSNVKSEE